MATAPTRSSLPQLAAGLGLMFGVAFLYFGFEATGGLSRGCGRGGFSGAQANVGYMFLTIGATLLTTATQVFARRSWAAVVLAALFTPLGLLMLVNVDGRPFVAFIALTLLLAGATAAIASRRLREEAAARARLDEADQP